jgi:hypothetical protein
VVLGALHDSPNLEIEPDPKLRSSFLAIGQREGEVMVRQDLRDYGEAAAATFALRGEEGREHLFGRRGIDP